MISAAVLAFIKRLAMPVLLLVLIALATWGAINAVTTSKEISVLEKSLQTEKGRANKAEKDLADGRLAGAKELAVEQEKNRKLALQWQTTFDKANQEASNEKRVLENAVASTVAERDRLRNETRTRTAYPQYASATACNPEDLRRVSATAAVLGELLVTSDGVSETLGRQAEGLATQLRYYQSASAALEN